MTKKNHERFEQLPVETPNADGRGSTTRHPAFGQVGVNRVSSTGYALYGSSFVHHNFITLRITESELNRDLSYDRHHPTRRLIEVSMTEGQWAQLVANPNQYDGVPCTINRVLGEPRPDIVLRVEEDIYKVEAQKKIDAAVGHVDAAIAKLDELGAGLSKTKRDQIRAELETLRRELGANLPFVARSLGQHMEHITDSAKTEVRAWMNGVVAQAGLTALTGTAPLALPAPEDSDPDLVVMAADGADSEQYVNPGVRERRDAEKNKRPESDE